MRASPADQWPKLTKRKQALRITRIVVLTVLVFSILVAFLVSMMVTTYVLAPLSTDPKAPSIVFIVHRGASDRQIGEDLQNRGLIRKAFGFVLAARIEHVAGKMVAGTYEFSPSQTPRAIAVAIALGRTAEDFVTVPEGFTLKQIAARLAAKGMVDEQVFLNLATNHGKSIRIGGFTPPSNDLEGFLFPDTYRVPRGTTVQGVIDLMVGEFATRVLPLDNRYLASHPAKIGPMITMASLVEREAEVDGDRPKIAGVLWNRLNKGMKLECDATIEYALPEHKARLFYKDLRVNSPYNTYLHGGLPPTPIANPGIKSIEAALDPSHSSNLYYVARPDGTHIFTNTLAAHLKAVAFVQSLRSKNKH